MRSFEFYNQMEWAILLGKSKFKDEYGLCTGKLDPRGNGCFLEAARKRLEEAFSIKTKLGKGGGFDEAFKDANGSFRVIMFNGTPVFVGVFPSLSRMNVNPELQRRCNDKEAMERVDWFNLQTLRPIDGRESLPVSKFAVAVARKIDVITL